MTDPVRRFCRPFQSVPLKDRTWPDKRITKAPRWASSDLRDGNQALVNPMTIEQKQRVFNLCVGLPFASSRQNLYEELTHYPAGC